MNVDVHEAKTHLSRLLADVQAGREVVISRGGRPIARLVPYEGPPEPPRNPGGWEGRVHIARDFESLPQDILDAFEGGTG